MQLWDILGVTQTPVIDSIEVYYYVVPILCLTIGIASNILDHIVAKYQAAVEKFSVE
jgi:hypothetical protein